MRDFKNNKKQFYMLLLVILLFNVAILTACDKTDNTEDNKTSEVDAGAELDNKESEAKDAEGVQDDQAKENIDDLTEAQRIVYTNLEEMSSKDYADFNVCIKQNKGSYYNILEQGIEAYDYMQAELQKSEGTLRDQIMEQACKELQALKDLNGQDFFISDDEYGIIINTDATEERDLTTAEIAIINEYMANKMQYVLLKYFTSPEEISLKSVAKYLGKEAIDPKQEEYKALSQKYPEKFPEEYILPYPTWIVEQSAVESQLNKWLDISIEDLNDTTIYRNDDYGHFYTHASDCGLTSLNAVSGKLGKDTLHIVRKNQLSGQNEEIIFKKKGCRFYLESFTAGTN